MPASAAGALLCGTLSRRNTVLAPTKGFPTTTAYRNCAGSTTRPPLDQIGLTLVEAPAIDAHEKKAAAAHP